MRPITSFALIAGLALSGCAEPAPEYDLVLAGGRVDEHLKAMDP